jgi:integrase/recombinase XerD
LLIDSHAAHLRMAAYRPSTVVARVSCLRAYERLLGTHQATLRTATRLEVELFLGRDLAPESRRAYLGHLRGFYAWALEEEYVSADPTVKLPAVRVPRAVPRPIHDDDLRKAVGNAEPRMRAWLLLMTLAGLRCLEVAALRPDDLSETDYGPLLFLRECKGGGTGVVPAHPAIIPALMALPIRDGKWWDCSARHVSSQVGVYLRSVGVNATAHRLRHSAGTEFYRASGNDLLTTAQLLRHASVKSTQIYSEIAAQRPAEVIRAMRAVI